MNLMEKALPGLSAYAHKQQLNQAHAGQDPALHQLKNRVGGLADGEAVIALL